MQQLNKQLSIDPQTALKLIQKGKTSCEICQKKFGMFNREHACKRCYRSVDESCSKNTAFIISYEIERHKQHRVCDICFKESDAQKQLKQSLDLKFGKDSKVAKSWLQSMNVQESDRDLEKRFIESNMVSEKMKQSTSYQNYLDSLPQFSQVLKENYKENYSYMEFYHNMTLDMAEGDIFRIIGNVIRAFLHIHCDTVGYNKDIFDLAVFLLMFLAPAKAWIILCRIYEDIVPKECYPLNMPKNNFKLQIDVVTWICQLIANKFQLQPNQLPKIKEFIEVEGLDYFSSFCILKVNVQVTYFLINYILNNTDKYIALVKIIVGIASCNIDSILNYNSSKIKITYMILENTQLQMLTPQIEFQTKRPDTPYFNKVIEQRVIESQVIYKPVDQKIIYTVQSQKPQENVQQFLTTTSIYPQQSTVISQPVQQNTVNQQSIQQQSVIYQQSNVIQQPAQQTVQSVVYSSESQTQLQATISYYQQQNNQLQQQYQQLQSSTQQSQIQFQQLQQSLQQRIQDLILQSQIDNENIFKLTQENASLKSEINKLRSDLSSQNLKQSTTIQFTQENEKMIEINKQLNQQISDYQIQIKQLNESHSLTQSQRQSHYIQITQEYERSVENIKQLTQQNYILQDQIRLLNDQIEQYKKIYLQNQDLQEQLRIKNEQYTILQSQKSSVNIQLSSDYERSTENIRRLTQQNYELQEQIKQLNEFYQLTQSQKQQTSIQATQNYEREVENNKKLNIRIIELQDQIRQMNEQFKLKIQQDRALFQKEFDQIQDQFEELETKYLKACMKVMLLSIKQQIYDLKQNKKQNQEQATQIQDYNNTRKGTMTWQSEIGVLTVRLNNKEKECDRIKKNLRDLEDKYEITVKNIKIEYEQITSQELKKVSHKFEIEKTYFEEHINSLRQKIIELESIVQQSEQLKIEIERITFMNSQLKQKYTELEGKQNIKSDELEALKRRHEQILYDHQNQVELVKKSSNQSQYEQKILKYTNEIDFLTLSLQDQKNKNIKICNRYVVQCLELKRVMIMSEKFYNEMKLLGTSNDQYIQNIKDLEFKIQQKNSQIYALEQEMASFKMFSSQVRSQDQTGKIGALERQINELTEKIRKLIDENSQYKFELENIKIQYNNSQNNLEFANSKLQTIKQDHDLEIQQIKEDYENVISHTVATCNQKIEKINIEWKYKEQQWKEKEKKYKEQIEIFEEKITMLSLELNQCQLTIQRLEEKIAILSLDIIQKNKQIDEQQQKISEQALNIEHLLQRIEKLENKLAQVVHELKYKSEQIDKLEIQVQDLRKQIQLQIIRIEELEETVAKFSMQLIEKQKYIESILQEINQYKIRIDEYIKRIGRYEERIAYYELEMEKKRSAYLRITMVCIENKRLQSVISNLMQKNKYILDLENKVTMLAMQLTEKQKYIDSFDYEFQQMKQRISQYEQEVQIKKNALVRVTLLSIENKRLQINTSKLIIQIQYLNKYILEKDAKIEQLENKLTMLIMELKQLNENGKFNKEQDEIIKNQKEYIERLLRENRDKQIQIDNYIIQIRSLEDELNQWRIKMNSMRSGTEQLEIEISIVRSQYHNRIKEVLKRYVMIFTELCRQRDNVQQLEEKKDHLELQNKKLNQQLQNILVEISDARLQLENMTIIKQQLSKKNFDLITMESQFKIFQEMNTKTLMRLIIVSMELERTTLQNNILTNQFQQFNKPIKIDSGKQFEDQQYLTSSVSTVIKKSSQNSGSNQQN